MRFAIVAEKSGLALGEYERSAPCVKLEQGKPRAGMKRPLDLAQGEETRVVYPLDGRLLECSVRRVEDLVVGVDPAKPGTDRTIRATVEVSEQGMRVLDARLDPPARPRVVEVERPARNLGGGSASVVAPKPPAKADAPPASTTRRRSVRKTP
jgi:hypothetical protein